ncbi:MAG TPA: ribonuclease J, partial [Armatimonadetes bacterium]|nr:ribonuclease J [Armatimonadota bacterium]
MSSSLRVIPLGGYGEIGKNCTVLETAGQYLIIDFGVAFPDENQARHADLLVNNFNFLRERRAQIAGLVLTHGHEDHIGGVPVLLADLQRDGWKLPVYGAPLTLGLLRAKLGGRAAECDLRVWAPGDRVPIGPFEVEPVHINHSIPDAVGLAIRTPAGLVYHSGDFKFDHTPIDGRPTDFATLAALGNEGVRALICDTTNVVRPGHTPSEMTVGRAFERIFPRVEGRLIIATFASQIHRLQQVFDAADRLGKKVLIAGRSMERNANAARELGHLHYRDEQRLSYGQLADHPADETVILITGSQGEPLSGLTRMARGTHPKLRLYESDTVLFSATAIPGNETTVWQVINDILARGAQVITHGQEQVHVSGHASSEEIKLLHNLIRPRTGLPFHGEYRHMVAYGELAQDLGLSHEEIYFLQNGDVLRLDDEGEALEQRVEHGTWAITGSRLAEDGLSDAVAADRGYLGESGVICGALAWDLARGALVGAPAVSVR